MRQKSAASAQGQRDTDVVASDQRTEANMCTRTFLILFVSGLH